MTPSVCGRFTALEVEVSSKVNQAVDMAHLSMQPTFGVPSVKWPNTLGLLAEEWTPRELRHSFVSLLSSAGIPIEDIAHLVGHANTRTTERCIARIAPVARRGAKAMDDLFNAHRTASEPPNLPPRPVRTNRALK